jgi:hypothetical protein
MAPLLRLHIRRFVLCFGILAALQTSLLHAACPGPVAGWNYWRDLDLANAGGVATAPLLLVNVDTATPIAQGKMRADGGDIRITDTNCNLLDHWVETGINSAATRIWVLNGATPAGASQLRMYYGAPAATFANNPAPIWGNGIAALYTFGEGSGTTAADHVGGFDLTLSGGVTWTAGFRPGVGALTGFASGRANRAGVGPLLGAANFTAFGFIYPTSANGSTQGMIGNFNNDGASGWVAKLQGGAGQMMLLTNQAGGWCQASRAAFANNTWASFGAERDTVSGHTIYQNGVVQGVDCAPNTRDVTTGAPGPLEIGRSYNNSYPFSGSISLMAIYTGALGATTEAALHTALVAGGNITVTPGSEILPTTTTTITSDSPDPSGVGQVVAVNFTVTPVGAGTPTGNVTVSAGPDSCIGTVATGTCNLTFTSAGAKTLTATYAGDGAFSGSVSAGEPHEVLATTAQGNAGGGLVTATFTGGTCIGFANGSTSFPAAPAPLPPGVTFPYGLFGFTAVCPRSGTLTLTVTYPNPLPPGTQYWKYGPTSGNPAPHWYVLPATLAGNTAVFTITDGGLGDDDLTADGDIEDQGGPGVPGVGDGATEIPTLSEWGLLLFAVLLGLLGFRRPRRVA